MLSIFFLWHLSYAMFYCDPIIFLKIFRIPKQVAPIKTCSWYLTNYWRLLYRSFLDIWWRQKPPEQFFTFRFAGWTGVFGDRSLSTNHWLERDCRGPGRQDHCPGGNYHRYKGGCLLGGGGWSSEVMFGLTIIRSLPHPDSPGRETIYLDLNVFGGHIHMSYFGGIETPVLEFWWRLLLVSKPEWILPNLWRQM